MQAYVNAIKSGVEDITKVLLTPEAQQQLAPKGPRVVHESYNVNKVIDTEDTEIKYKAQEDGTLVTEQKKTTQHEELYDDELPPGIENHEKVNHTVRRAGKFLSGERIHQILFFPGISSKVS